MALTALVVWLCLLQASLVSMATRGSRSSNLEMLQAQLDQMVSANGGGDVQFAACRISSKELLATAESTARNVLQGVCNPREIDDRLHNLETQMAGQFNVIKTMLLNIEEKLSLQEAHYRRANRKLHGAVAVLSEGVQACALAQTAAAPTSAAAAAAAASGSTPSPASAAPLRSAAGTSDGVFSTGADPDDDEEGTPNPRQDEIDRFNSSIHLENGKRVFTYYWQVFDMDYKLNSWGYRRSLRSPSFYVFTDGYMMYLRMYPRQNGQNVYIHVGLTKGEYDEALQWPFTLKQRITVIDQSSSPQDIVSRIWNPTTLCSASNWQRPTSGDNYECVGLGFPHEDLRARNYIRDDSIIVKLTVYLD